MLATFLLGCSLLIGLPLHENSTQITNASYLLYASMLLFSSVKFQVVKLGVSEVEARVVLLPLDLL